MASEKENRAEKNDEKPEAEIKEKKVKSEKTLTLNSSDEQQFTITETAALFSETIKNMVEDGCADSAIPLPVVDAATLSKVVAYLSKKAEIASLTEEEKQKFEEEFLGAEQMNVLFDLILAANYLNIKDLMKAVSQKIADTMKNKSVKWVRKTFGIENDFTPEEEQAIRDEYPWAWEGVDPDEDDD